MADFLERATIQRDAGLNPFTADFVAPTDTSAAVVVATVNFARRVRSAIEDIAHEIIQAAITNPPASTGPENEKVIWAQKVVNGERYDQAVLRLILAEFDTVAPADLAAVTDQQMHDYLLTIVPILARGIRK